MSMPTLIDFNKARNEARQLNNERSCHLDISNIVPFVGDLPQQFTMTVVCTKAAKKRGQYAKALQQFTGDNWFAVLLEQPTTWNGRPASELIFTMNPTFKAHIESNIDAYRYDMLMEKIKGWDQGFNNLKMDASLLTNYLGWELSKRVEIITKKHLYDRLVECGSFASATTWLFQNSNSMLDTRNRSPLPMCYQEVLRQHLSTAQSILCSIFGRAPTPRVRTLDEVILSHIQ